MPHTYVPHTYCIAYTYVVYPIRWQTSRATPSACRAATAPPISGINPPIYIVYPTYVMYSLELYCIGPLHILHIPHMYGKAYT